MAVRALAAAVFVLLTIRSPAMAADISLNQSDPAGQSSFNTGANWTDGLAPTAGNNYFTSAFTLRTPNDSSSNFTFAGDALTIDASGALRYVGLANATPVITVNNLIMEGGLLINGANEIASGTSTLTLSGSMTIKSNSGLNLGITDSMTHNMVLNSTLTGTGGFYIGTSTVSGSINPASLVTINGNNSGFSGGFFISRNYTDKNSTTVTLNGTNATYPQIMSSATIRLGHANALGTGQLGIDAGTVDLNGLSPSIGSLAGTGGAVVNNGGGAVTLTVGNDNTTSTYSGTIRDRTSGAGTLALTKTGNGVLTLSGSNSFTGGTQINAGVLAFGHTSGLGTGTVTIGSGTLRAAVSGTVANPIATNGSRIDTNGNSVRLSGVISGSNGLTKAATSGTLTLAGDNTFAGNVVVDGSSSVLVATRNTSLGTGTKTVTVTGFDRSIALDGSGGNITLGSSISYSFSNNTTQALWNLAGNNTVSGSISMTVGGGDTIIRSDAGSLTLAGNIGVSSANLRTLTLTGSAVGTVSGTVWNGNGTTALAKTGAGTWTLSGSNTYTGGTQINAGVLAIANTGALGTGTVTISCGTLRATMSGTVANPIAVNAARVDTSGNAFTLAGLISGSNGFTKTATSGTLTLAGDNTFTGNVTLDGATPISPDSVLVVTRSTSLGTGAKTVSVAGYGKTLILDGTAGDITLASTIGFSVSNDGAAAILNRAGNNTISGSIGMTLGGGGTIIQSDAGSLTLTGNIGVSTGSRALTLRGSAGGTVSGNVTNGAGTMSALNKAGTGTWTLSGSNTYSGTTSVAAGVLTFGRQAALYSGTTASWTRSNITVESGATLGVQVGDAASGSFDSTAVDTLLGAGGLGASNASSGLKSGALFAFDTANATAGSFTYASTIANPNSGTNVLGIVKLGSGTLTLSGSSTYTGGATVSVGRLALGHANALGTGTTTVAGGELNIATFAPSVAGFRITSGTLLGTGTLTAPTYGLGGGTVTANLGSGTVTVTANAALSGMSAATMVNLNAGTLALGSGGRFTSSTVAVSGSAGSSLTLAGNESFGSFAGAANVALGSSTLSVGSANTSTIYSGSLSGPGVFAKFGTGTLTLSGNNSHSGGTQIAAGTLQLGSSTALPTSSALTLGTGSTSGVLAFNGNTATLNSITFNGSGSQLSGTASGGKLNLLASGTNNATITVNSGSHALHPDTTLQSNTVINVAAGSLFSLHGVIDGSKSLTQIGSGTVAIFGANSYTGGTYLNGGYLSVQNTGALGSGTVTIDGNSILNLNNTILGNTVVFGSGSGAIINSGSLVNVTGTYSITSGTGASITTNYSVQSGGDISFVSNLASTVSIEGSAVGTFSSGVLEAGTVLVNAGGRGTFSGGMAGNVTTSGSALFSGDVLGNVTVSGGTATFTAATGAASAINVNSGLGVVTGTIGNTAHATAAGATLEIRGRVLSTADVNAEAGATVKLMGSQAFDGTTLDNDGSVIVNRTANLTLAAVISGTGSLTKTDATTLTLTGTSTFTGLTTVSAGTLAVNGGLAGPVAVATGAVVGGSGVIGGTLSGAGLVSPGNSPGILTAGQFDATSGLDAAFEFTAFSPVYNASSASENDVLQLTSGSPFIGSLGSGNVIDVYFNVDSIASGDSFEGGFFTGLSAGDLFSAVQNATFQYWIKDNAGTTVFGGVGYSPLTSIAGITGVSPGTATVTRDFGAGSITGSVTQFVIVPEADTVWLAAIGVVIAGWSLRQRRFPDSPATCT
ncbi:MAG: beta strand repeat-containing protein [Planctomycetia bacterium]